MTDEHNNDETLTADVGGETLSPSQSSSRKKPILVLVAVVVVVLIAVFVLSRNGKSDPPSTTTPTSSTDTTISPVDQKIITDYRAFWDAYLEASNPMRPDSPALAAHSTGDEYAKLVNSFSGAKASNVIFKGTLDVNAKVTSVISTHATLRDCLLDNTGSYDVTTGARQDVSSGTRDQVDVSLDLIDSTWKVSRLDKRGEGCTAP